MPTARSAPCSLSPHMTLGDLGPGRVAGPQLGGFHEWGYPSSWLIDHGKAY